MAGDKFSATEPTLGYLYQIRHALYLAMAGREEANTLVEIIDDVSIHAAEKTIERLQLKHSPKPLTNSSVALWKTLRIWSEALADGSLDVSECRLALVSTAAIPDGSVAEMLSGLSRDVERIVGTLTEVAKKSKNKDLAKSFKAFLDLSPAHREALVQVVEVIGNAPRIDESRELVMQQLRMVRQQHRVPVFERLEGWWFNRVVNSLVSPEDPVPVSGFQVWDYTRELAEQFHEDSLPIDYEDAMAPNDDGSESDNRVFVLQMRELNEDGRRIRKAVSDYYRAFRQRARWVRDQLLIGNELQKYEDKLADEWERVEIAFSERFGESMAEEEMRRFGRELLNWMEFQSDARIRPSVDVAYVRRGSYHMLADESPPRVYWHPEFRQRLAKTLEERLEVK